jgi:hypothetical protein
MVYGLRPDSRKSVRLPHQTRLRDRKRGEAAVELILTWPSTRAGVPGTRGFLSSQPGKRGRFAKAMRSEGSTIPSGGFGVWGLGFRSEWPKIPPEGFSVDGLGSQGWVFQVLGVKFWS